jgi:G6PDH family F420-dependent oxidoreductase
MTVIGYTMMCEQSGPKALVADVQAAERAGFEFAVISDHYFPWVEAMGHSPYAWSVLGAAAQVTGRIELMTYVTCPIKRYHPAVVAQKAATVDLLADGRFTLGVGAGENLNEHVTGGGWPPVNVRHQMLEEAVDIIRALWTGDYVSYDGRHFQVDSARVWDLPERPPALAIAASGGQSAGLAGRKADGLIAVEPSSAVVGAFDAAGGTGKPRIGQLPICYDPDRDAAIDRARELFAWFGGGWKVNAELPGTAAFEAAAAPVRRGDIADAIPCGDSTDAVVKAVQRFADAGFTHVALCQIGGDHQQPFLSWWERELGPALGADRQAA